MKLLCTVILAVLALAAGSALAQAGEGGVASLSANSPLARKQHPRLLITRQMLPELRRRCRTVYADEYGNMLRWADQRVETVISEDREDKASLTDSEVRDLLGLAFLWQMTAERRYADAAVRLLEVYAEMTAPRAWTDSQSWREGHYTGYIPERYLSNIAVIYDLLHNAMLPEQRARIGGRVLDGVVGRRNVPMMGYRLASTLGFGKAAGVLAIYGDSVNDAEATELLSELLQYVHEDLLPSHRIVSYRRGAWAESMHCGCFEEYQIPFFWFLSNATGHNYLKTETVYKAMATWYVYNIAHFGPGPNSNVVPVSSIYHGGVGRKGSLGMPICAAGSGDGLAAWLVRQRWWQENRGLDLDKLPARDAWYKILFLDPEAEIVAPQELPETALFEGIGWVSMRSSWKPDATFAHFKCGHWRRGEPAHLDNNSFYIYKNGPLAIDGIKPGTNVPDDPGTPLQKLAPYGRMTIAHNTVTVYDPNERIMGVSQFGWKRARKPFPVNDGGQTFRPEKLVDNPPRLEQGRIMAYQTHRLFDYVCGDATESYIPRKLQHFTRQFVYLKPDCFVVFDRVLSTKASFAKHWLLHSHSEPEITGDTVKIDAAGDRPSRGRLFCRTLLPRSAKIDKYHKGTLVRMGSDITPEEVWDLTEDSWRVEMEPNQQRTDDLFLHVLHACDPSVGAMVGNELIARHDRVGARLTHAARTWEVQFNTTGRVGGHISIRERGNTLVHQKLGDNIDDNYNGWKGDSRHKDWMTNQSYSNARGSSQ